jgi:hypothetical protein
MAQGKGELRLVFERLPGTHSIRFIDAEDASGQSVNIGEWRLRSDGRAELVVTVLPGIEPSGTPIYQTPPRIEDYVKMFHEGCGGVVTGPLDNLVCAECGLQMDAFTRQAGPTSV